MWQSILKKIHLAALGEVSAFAWLCAACNAAITRAMPPAEKLLPLQRKWLPVYSVWVESRFAGILPACITFGSGC